MPLRLRRPTANRTSSYLKFLKPGALAQLRDSRISAKSSQFDSNSQICLYSSPVNAGQPPADEFDGLPCFAGRIYGPRRPQMKKLVAAKYVYFPSSPVSDSLDPVINVFSNDLLLAH